MHPSFLIHQLHLICHKCGHAVDSSGRVRNGLCDLNGEKIGDNCERGICPENRFTADVLEAASKPPEPPPETQPIPRSEWPPRIQKIAELATDADKGIGSLIERLIATNESWVEAAKIIADEFGKLTTIKAAFSWAIGKECGCDARRDVLDQKYPLAAPVIVQLAIERAKAAVESSREDVV